VAQAGNDRIEDGGEIAAPPPRTRRDGTGAA